MHVRIQRVDDGYTATVSPSHGDNVRWETSAAVDQGVLIDALTELGFHQQDIGDAFYEADPGWLERPLHESRDT